jgi:2,3-dihydroxybenzoate-AMP ligase
MLDGVTPFPAEFAARYRALGYWEDRPLFDGFTAALAAYADRVAVVDEIGPVTYSQLSERSERLARALLDCGLEPLDRIIVQLPNTAMFAYLYFALLRIGAASVLALPGHRRREITQFAEISAAKALAGPAAARGFDFAAMAADVMTDRPDLRLCLIQGLEEAPNDPRFVRLEDLLSREPRSSREALEQIRPTALVRTPGTSTGRVLPLRRPAQEAAVRELRGRGAGQGPDQPRRGEDQRRGGGEPHPQ